MLVLAAKWTALFLSWVVLDPMCLFFTFPLNRADVYIFCDPNCFDDSTSKDILLWGSFYC